MQLKKTEWLFNFVDKRIRPLEADSVDRSHFF